MIQFCPRLVALLLLAPASACALSTVKRVTPKNIGNQPFVLSVSAVPLLSNDSMRFEVVLSAKTGTLHEGRSGHLTIWQEEEAAQSQLNELGSRLYRSPVLVSCNVREQMADAAARYLFDLHKTMIPKASFMIIFSAQGVPAFNGYEIVVADFMDKSR